MTPRHLVLIAACVLALCVGETRSAYAHAVPPSRGAPDASELPPGPLKRAILDIQKRLHKQKRSAELVAQPLDEAIRAGSRARGARASGDARHAAMLERLGMAWTKVAETVVSAVAAEERAAKAAKRLGDLRTKVERAEALLTEQQARLKRLRSEVDESEKAKRAAEDAALSEEQSKAEKAKPKGKKR